MKVTDTIILSINADEVITQSGYTVKEESLEAIKLCGKALAQYNYWYAVKHPESVSATVKASYMRSLIEADEKEALAKAMNAAKKAAAKLTWLNSRVREISGHEFIREVVDLSDASACMNLVGNFYLENASAYMNQAV